MGVVSLSCIIQSAITKGKGMCCSSPALRREDFAAAPAAVNAPAGSVDTIAELLEYFD
jgi:hypothetical protein